MPGKIFWGEEMQGNAKIEEKGGDRHRVGGNSDGGLRRKEFEDWSDQGGGVKSGVDRERTILRRKGIRWKRGGGIGGWKGDEEVVGTNGGVAHGFKGLL